MNIVQVNSTVSTGSTGRIAADIGDILLESGHNSSIAFGRDGRPSRSRLIRIGERRDLYLHVAKTRVLDRHGFGSRRATIRFLQQLLDLDADLLHLHNLHGYYINIGVLFNFIRLTGIPTVWTLHDSWAYTGHCTYYDSVGCMKWKSHCSSCPKTNSYPSSYVLDQSRRNFSDKKSLYADLTNLHLVAPSRWLADEVQQSFFKGHRVRVIYNGIDTKVFRPCVEVPRPLRTLGSQRIVLGVASVWDTRKGLHDFLLLRELLDSSYTIVLVGLSSEQAAGLPNGMVGVTRTEDMRELGQYYSSAEVFVNPTHQDNFPTTNIEALACGTPVITYDTGGSPEAIDENTGIVVDKGNVQGLCDAIVSITSKGKTYFSDFCRRRALDYFDKNDRYYEYIRLYEHLIKRKRQ